MKQMRHKYDNPDFLQAVKQIGEEYNVDEETAKKMIIRFLELILKGVEEDKRFKITGFGLFYLKQTVARERYIPTLGRKRLCKSREVFQFKPSPSIILKKKEGQP